MVQNWLSQELDHAKILLWTDPSVIDSTVTRSPIWYENSSSIPTVTIWGRYGPYIAVIPLWMHKMTWCLWWSQKRFWDSPSSGFPSRKANNRLRTTMKYHGFLSHEVPCIPILNPTKNHHEFTSYLALNHQQSLLTVAVPSATELLLSLAPSPELAMGGLWKH